jgi:hypothetical protein
MTFGKPEFYFHLQKGNVKSQKILAEDCVGSGESMRESKVSFFVIRIIFETAHISCFSTCEQYQLARAVQGGKLDADPCLRVEQELMANLWEKQRRDFYT